MDNNLEFTPFCMSGCDDICKQIKSNEKIYQLIEGNNFDDFAVSWEGMFLHQAYHIFKENDWDKYDERMNSILYSYFESQTMQLEWVIFSLLYGQYDLVLRELRNNLEGAFLFYGVDIDPNYTKKSGEEKFKIVDAYNERDTFGKNVFSGSGYYDWQRVYTDIYRPLCKYTHTNISITKNKKTYPDYNEMLTPEYDEQFIMICLYFLQQVLITEVDMMKIVLKDAYGLDGVDSLDNIFDKIIIPRPQAL